MTLAEMKTSLLASFALFTLLLAGCASKTPQLKVYPSEGLPFSQRFPRGFLGVNELGDSEILLISEGTENARKQTGKILYPTNIGSVKQIVHIRLLWKPLPGARNDQPSATNATINWYVRSNMPGEENDKLDYGGAGFVAVYPDKRGAHIVIRNANLALRDQQGQLQDVFQKPSISGSFDVVRNDGVVKDVLSQLNTRVATR
jgi:hypothetical protein